MTLPPPGWYTDPDDPTRLRWWDGEGWSLQAPPTGEPVRASSDPAPLASSDPAPSAASDPAPSASSDPAPSAASEPAPSAASNPAPSASPDPAPSASSNPAPLASSNPAPAPRLGLRDAVRAVASNPVDFRSRASRAELWWWYLAAGSLVYVLVLLQVTAGIVGTSRALAEGDFGGGMGGGQLALLVVLGLVVLALFLPTLSVTVRRLHDVGLSGLWLLTPLGGLALLILGAVVIGVSGPAVSPMFMEPTMGTWMGLGFGTIVVGLSYPIAYGAQVALVVHLARRGAPGPNRFGPPPGQHHAPTSPTGAAG